MAVYVYVYAYCIINAIVTVKKKANCQLGNNRTRGICNVTWGKRATKGH